MTEEKEKSRVFISPETLKRFGKLLDRGKYLPHQGEKERARRMRQMEKAKGKP